MRGMKMDEFITGVIRFLANAIFAFMFVCMIYASQYVLAFISLVLWLVISTWM